MSTLIVGGGGMLGRAVSSEGRSRGAEVHAYDRDQFDLLDAREMSRVAETVRPTSIINCAALTAVDECEERAAEAMAVNGTAVGDLAEISCRLGAHLVQVSTDFVFDGGASRPYREEDPPEPLSSYGRSKLEGERRALEWDGSLVLRTSWLFGPGGANFVTAMVGRIDADDKPLQVVDDQIGCPTYTVYLARAIWDLLSLRSVGILHYRNRHPVSWRDFAERIASLLGDEDEVEAISTEDLARPAPRPRYSVLDVSRFESLVGQSVDEWEVGLSEYLQTIRDRGLS